MPKHTRPQPREVLSPLETLRIRTRSEAIDAMQRWSLDRILQLDDTIRTEVVQLLIQKLSEFEVTVPPLWYDIVGNPTTYSEQAKDAFGLAPDLLLLGDDIGANDSRPTGTVESEQVLVK